MDSKSLGSHKSTYDAIFHHPAPHNLHWRDVRSMLAVVAEEVEERSGKLKYTRNGETLVLHPHANKDVTDIKELMQIRHFLERTDAPVEAAPAAGENVLVVVDHHEARVFKSTASGTEPLRIKPYDPTGHARQVHAAQEDVHGQRTQEQRGYYDDIAKALQGAQKVLLFGDGTGASSAMEQLQSELKQHHADVLKAVVGAQTVDEQHLTDDQLLAKAREFYAGAVATTK